MSEELCHCGQPLHYSDPATEKRMRELVAEYGENVEITVQGQTYLVPRHYIALHGIRAWEISRLGFATKQHEGTM